MDLGSGSPHPLKSFQVGIRDIDSLHGVGMLDLLQNDPRPTFILDVESFDLLREKSLTPVYWNHALAAAESGGLLAALWDRSTVSDSVEAERSGGMSWFRRWIFSGDATSGDCVYSGVIWTRVVVKRRWMVLSGLTADTNAVNRKDQDPVAETSSRRSSNNKAPTFDWTDERPPLRMTPHVAWARGIDWAQTSLGPLSTWTSQLRSFANLAMQDPRPAVIFYGPDLVMVYNEPYIELLGGLHPCMGVSARVALAGVWSEYFEPIIQKNLQGEAVERINFEISVGRNGFLEETYFSLKFIPIYDLDGATVGHYEPLIETTRDVLAQRRSQTLLEISEEVPKARNSEEFWALATKMLSHNNKDTPFALLYSASADEKISVSAEAGLPGESQTYTLRGSLGVPEGSPARIEHLHFRDDYGLTKYFRQAVRTQKPSTVHFDRDSAAAELVRDVQWQGFGEPCRAAAICPLTSTASTGVVLGFVVMGLNPRRPYDEDYQQFILVASRLLSATLISITSHEDDIRRREQAISNAEAMKQELRKKLHESQREAERNVSKFQRFAERSDVGIFIIRKVDGVYTYRNEAWFTILDPDVDREIELGAAWGALIDDEYVPLGQAKFEALLETKKHQSFELRLKRTWDAPSQVYNDPARTPQPMWVLCSIFPELEEGEVLEIIGCITDISRQKWSERLQATQALLAQESKQQLESFIDTTSHEMRNPLSAIIQSADSIISSQQDFDLSKSNQVLLQKVLDPTKEAAETIVHCANMKTIVDDVLTLSKLDSGLLVMTPIDIHLESIARDAVKMFEGEAKSSGIDVVLRLESQKLENQWVSLDPTRIVQVLINLLTNAIKFTRLERTRRITVSLDMSPDRPSKHADDIHESVPFMQVAEASEPAKSLQSDWKTGEIIYPIFSVQDTGCGLNEAGKALLFARFSQVSPRTHIDYGGSGLGLFISRRLTEMHGGAIGFASKAGVGSTFSFFIKSRKVQTPTKSESTTVVNYGLRASRAVVRSQSFEKGRHASQETHLIKGDLPPSDLYILIVEDNLVNQRVLARQLRSLGIKVAVANHGGEALEYLRITKYCRSDESAKKLSLILMDWEMPVMDGLECVRNIRQLQKDGIVQGYVPVIAVTANARSEQVEVALEAGMDDVISKPFRIPELCACINKTLSSTARRQ